MLITEVFPVFSDTICEIPQRDDSAVLRMQRIVIVDVDITIFRSRLREYCT